MRRGGFTLVEMLVAVLVGLLVMAGLHQMFVSGLTAQTTTSSQMEIDRRAQVAMDEITSTLRQASPSLLTLQPPILDNFDTQHPDRVHCAAAPAANLEPATDGSGNAQDVRYWVAGGSLYRKIGGSGYTGGSALATGVTKMAFTFYDAAGNVTNDRAQTVRVGASLMIQDGANWSVIGSTVRLRNS
jgi:prepilin-type N-terminal cleavage/methylation domain-containing protein